MALTVTFDAAEFEYVGQKQFNHITVTPDASYAIAGEAITAAQCGLTYLERIIFEPVGVFADTPDFAIIPFYSRSAGKVQFFWADDAAPFDEVPDTTDLSAYTFRGIAVGW